MAPFIGSILSKSLRVHQIYGANTNVGKTIFSTLLCLTTKKRYPKQLVHYLKPISTGPEDQSDVRHILKFSKDAIATAKILQQYKEPISPHIAAVEPPSDHELLHQIQSYIRNNCGSSKDGTLILETAGGVNSPSTSGTSQVDLYRPLRLPIILVADSRLGGISTTISAFESLRIRGYDVDGVLIFRDNYYRNHEYLMRYFSDQGRDGGIPTTVTDPPPSQREESDQDYESMANYYTEVSESSGMADFVEKIQFNHTDRINKLGSMSKEATEHIWYPFTQHHSLDEKNITVIDSAHGDFFQAVSSQVPSIETTPQQPLINPMFDASASWWTQGLGHGDLSLSMSAAYAAGRYGHVMFAGAIHEPALKLAKMLLENMPTNRLKRAFYSDNGSTGVEVALKMAMKATRKRYGLNDGKSQEVLGLKGSYHGDTMGAMDCSEPGTFNAEVDWYKGRGYWFDFPSVGMRQGRWIVSVPSEIGGQGSVDLGTDISALFNFPERSKSPLAKFYHDHITTTISRLTIDQGRSFGAVIIEPVVLGAGGMLFCDPLFQHLLVSIVRKSPHLFSKRPSQHKIKENSWSGLPVIFDEVFTGLYRLGHFSSSKLLQCYPDISIHAKLLTGGLMPLCVTLASENIFDAFLSTEKKDALLHGHSYTAHAVGCEVACKSLETLLKLDKENMWAVAKNDWALALSDVNKVDEVLLPNHTTVQAWSVWGRRFVHNLSHNDQVERVWALGSVLAIHLRVDDDVGYSSNGSKNFLDQMATLQVNEGLLWNVHARALGSVVYIMAGQKTEKGTLETLEAFITNALK
ncbi:onanonoxo-7-onima-8-eninoihtemlysoneda [Geopyxis carbonaria]|nr:onanonoxo-7-onima-8-eninoihtemlysoneda [Geopyxis carbonaria]